MNTESYRVSWLLARSPNDRRASQLQRQYGSMVTACVTLTPTVTMSVKQPKPPPPTVVQEENSRFWVSSYVPPHDGRPAIITHRGFRDRDRAETCKAELEIRRGEAAICLTDARPAGVPKWHGDAPD